MAKKKSIGTTEESVGTIETETGPVGASVPYTEGPSAEDAKKKTETPKSYTPKGDVEIETTGGAMRYTLHGKTIKDKPTRFSPKDFTPEQWAAMRTNPSIQLRKAEHSSDLD